MSNNGLTHNIRNSFEIFDPRVYDNLDHQNLYALDLNCDYAVEVLRQVLTVYIHKLLIFERYVERHHVFIVVSSELRINVGYNQFGHKLWRSERRAKVFRFARRSDNMLIILIVYPMWYCRLIIKGCLSPRPSGCSYKIEDRRSTMSI